MASCCESPAGRAPCRGCGGPGRLVSRLTVEALVRPEVLARLGGRGFSFCPTADCSTVYFADDEALHLDDVSVPVFQKEAAGNRVICYCLGIRENLIREEAERTGASSAAARIRELVQSGRCGCDVLNPQGTCCLGQVLAVERSAGAGPAEPDVSVEPGAFA